MGSTEKRDGAAGLFRGTLGADQRGHHMFTDTAKPQPADRLPLVRDWITLGLFGLCLALWLCGLMLSGVWPLAGFVLVVLTLVLHSSLSHETLHGGLFRSQRACDVLGMVQPGLFVPYLRFKRTHLAHHMDANLTDPYDDPEANYMDPAVWHSLTPLHQRVLRINNTLLGRMVLGPVLGQWQFMASDLRAVRAGDQQVARDWALHLAGLVQVIAVVSLSPMSWWAYLGAAYLATSVLKIRTFLEHCAHARASARTAIVEDRGLLAFLFMNNNLHVVHHMHPSVAWYKLPRLYRAHRDHYRARNDGYVYPNYRAIFRHYLWRSKDPVPHPLWTADSPATQR